MIYTVNILYQSVIQHIFVYYLLCHQACQPHQQVRQDQVDPENVKSTLAPRESPYSS